MPKHLLGPSAGAFETSRHLSLPPTSNPGMCLQRIALTLGAARHQCARLPRHAYKPSQNSHHSLSHASTMQQQPCQAGTVAGVDDEAGLQLEQRGHCQRG